MRYTLTLLVAAMLFLSACGDQSQSSDQESEGMGQFASEQEFKDAHEKPEDINLDEKGSWVEFDTPDGQTGKAYALMTKEASSDYLFVIHEWWGLNDQVKKEAERLHEELGVNVMALDMYDGNVTDDPNKAGEYMQGVQQDRLEAIVNGALAKAGPEARVGTIGWCFGGGWSLRSSILAGDQGIGCVIYYGMPVENAADLAPLKADMLGIFAKSDKWINEEVIGNFENLAAATNKKIDSHWYEADHAFANPSSPRYNESAAQDANAKALAFLKERF